MQPFAVIKWPEVCDFRRHRATVGVSSNVTKLRKVALYANELRLPMGVKRWEHMLSSEGKMEKVMLIWEISAHMQTNDVWKTLSEIVCIQSDPCIDSHSSCSWYDILCPAAIYIQILSPPECSFSATMKKTTTTTKRFLVLPLILYFTRNKSLLW